MSSLEPNACAGPDPRSARPHASLRRRGPALFATAMLLLLASAAHAGALSIMPTRVEFAAGRGVQSLLLTNLSAESVTVEAQVVTWPDGAARLQANDVVVTPAVITLPPNQRSRVRIGLLRRGGVEVEHAYRIYFTELPTPSAIPSNGIGVRLQLGVPVFVQPETLREEVLAWAAREGPAGWQLEATNPGNVHVRLNTVELGSGGGSGAPAERLALPSLYVLPSAAAPTPLTIPLRGRPAPGARVRWTEGSHEHESVVSLP